MLIVGFKLMDLVLCVILDLVKLNLLNELFLWAEPLRESLPQRDELLQREELLQGENQPVVLKKLQIAKRVLFALGLKVIRMQYQVKL